MLPTSKSMLEFVNEMNRFFPRSSENVSEFLPSTPSTSQSFNQSLRSSSSTETSPDSIDNNHDRYLFGQNFQSPTRPDQSPAKPNQRFPKPDDYKFDFLPNTLDETLMQQPIYETPLVRRNQHPNRKIITVKSLMENDEITNVIWSQEQFTPPNSIIQNSTRYFEMLPSNEDRVFNNYTPPKIQGTPITKKSNASHYTMLSHDMPPYEQTSSFNREVSPHNRQLSPENRQNTPLYRQISPISNNSSQYSQRFRQQTFQEPVIAPSTSYRQNSPNKLCTFCRKNGETPLVYMTHVVKEQIGENNIVTCPILRSHVCSACGASGDYAHTISYCPMLRKSNNGKPLLSTTVTLKNTRVKSNGRRRF